MFADNFVGLITNTADLQTLINLVQEFMVFSIEVDTGTFKGFKLQFLGD